MKTALPLSIFLFVSVFSLPACSYFIGYTSPGESNGSTLTHESVSLTALEFLHDDRFSSKAKVHFLHYIKVYWGKNEKLSRTLVDLSLSHSDQSLKRAAVRKMEELYNDREVTTTLIFLATHDPDDNLRADAIVSLGKIQFADGGMNKKIEDFFYQLAEQNNSKTILDAISKASEIMN